ncbi:4'-phosphopantetheinyl transferase family protein [Streptomyces caatingaensis]|uniref:4'-phosphopantetheinyl transferase family protein n=1 Tax=Streptomyces caatingaensis TaxID=1678637 RepID=UPI0006727333|nr:4'-phosphopantetheinyl transferase superfamily protein [Streptomyces caatingaensis]
MGAGVARRGGPPRGTVIGFADADEDGTALPHGAERGLMAALPAARRDDFRLGRTAAARCLARLGTPGPVLADGRLPRFPAGVVGSISHRDGTAVCLAAADPHIRAVGVDIERAGALPPAAARLLCTERERAWLEHRPDGTAGPLAALFSLKESVYKALCALGVTVRGFKDIDCPTGGPDGLPVTGPVTVRGVRLETGGLRSAHTVLTWAVART